LKPNKEIIRLVLTGVETIAVHTFESLLETLESLLEALESLMFVALVLVAMVTITVNHVGLMNNVRDTMNRSGISTVIEIRNRPI
jgi:hypothetical protein